MILWNLNNIILVQLYFKKLFKRFINTMRDPFNLERFKIAQDVIYHRVVAELADGQKRSHWMWYIFPQYDGLGFSSMAKEYAIKSLDEAKAYIADALLGGRLNECSRLVLSATDRSAQQIFGFPDVIKLRSSMTLFAAVSESNSIFQQVIDAFYQGEADPQTLRLIGE